MKFAAIAAFLFLTFTPAAIQAKAVTFPADSPQFSVTIDDSWNPQITSANIISAQPSGAPFAISIFPCISTTAPTAVEETLNEVEKRFTDVTLGKLAHFTNRNRVTFLERYGAGKDGSSDREMLIAAFTIDGTHYYGLFQAGTPPGTKQYAGDVVAILKSIAPIEGIKHEPQRGR